MTGHARDGASPESDLAVRVAATRAAHQLTQAELAALVGVSTAMVNRWERGRAQPRAAHLAALGLIERYGPAAVDASAAAALPTSIGSFVGRTAELATLAALVLRSRLLTLTGAGGAGKTRLALELARRAAERFVHGVVFAELAALTDARLLDGSVAAAAGVREQSGVNSRDLLVQYLRERRLLLVLDNCEHVLAEAAELSAALLRGCPGLQILATSRESLGVYGEVVWPVAPLSLPPLTAKTLAAITSSEAVQLFVQRARERTPAFALTDDNAVAVAGICRRLDGLPLALELAAGWIRVLAPARIAASLGERLPLLRTDMRDVPARQQTLEATIDWSHALLDAGERWLFSRLAVFSGGFDLEALEATCAGGADEGAALPWLLDRLVNKSLVVGAYQEARPRFSLLETIRAYALARLQAGGYEDAVRQNHATYYIDLAEQLAPGLDGPRQRELLARLELEHDNLRAALTWLESQDDSAGFVRLAVALIAFYESRGLLAEGRALLERALARGPRDAALRLTALLGAGRLAYRQNDYRVAQARVAECLPLARAVGDRQQKLQVLHLLGIVTHAAGDYPAARTHLEAALALARELDHVHLCARLLSNLGLVASDDRDFAAARGRFADALALAAEHGLIGDAGIVLHCSAHSARRQGDAEQAHALHCASLALFVEISSRQAIAESLAGLAILAGCLQQPVRAARLLGAAAMQFETAAGGLAPSYQAEHAAVVARVRAALGEQLYARHWAAGSALSLDEAVAAGWAANDAPAHPPDTATQGQRAALAAPAGLALSPREHEVLRLLASGATNREIAATLVLSVRTVEHHLLNVYAKTGTRGRSDATAYALRHALVAF